MLKLVYTMDGVRKEHELAPGITTIGRAADCDITLLDRSVSRRHANIQVFENRCEVSDLQSSNGTYLNGSPVTVANHIEEGDTIRVGSVHMRVRAVGAELTLAEGYHVEGTLLSFPCGQSPAASEPRPTPADPERLRKLLSEIARTLVKNEGPAVILNRVVDLVFASVPADRVFLILIDDTGKPVPRVVRARDGSAVQTAISQTIVRRVMTERVALSASDIQPVSWLNEASSVITSGVRSFLCAPLWDEDRVIGVLYGDSCQRTEFSSGDLDLFTALANYAAVAIDQARLSSSLLKEARSRERLQCYHSPAVVSRILAEDAAGPEFLAQERDLSILIADLVGFTSMSEGMKPMEAAHLLNLFFTETVEVIFKHEGTLDKFTGDGLLAVFGAPFDQPGHALKAVKAALDMRRSVAALNARLVDRPQLHLRIAVHSGLAMAGDIGSPRRREYTVLGDVVNTASRLQAEVAGPDQIVITGATYERVRAEIAARSLGWIKLRGRTAELEVFEVE